MLKDGNHIMIEKLEFIKKFSDKCKTNSAAVFLGAGMSVDAGLPSWKQLFQPLAEKLKIDIENTGYQIYDIAQFYANTFGKNELYKRIGYEINRVLESSDALDQLSYMQCNSFWTTNFDSVLESNLSAKGKITNVISKEADLISCDLTKNINIFKMNGDIRDIQNATVTKSDLEKYADNHDYLLSFFKRELITKTFLFLGYSFTDSLVLPCVSELSRAFNNNQPHHYTILKRVDSHEFYSFVDDLEKRYQIDVVLIDDYREIKEILMLINFYTHQRNVFISGSYYSPDDNPILNEINGICKAITKILYTNNFTIINGYGYKIGYYIASEATRMMIEENVTDFRNHLKMYPFDEHLTPKEKTKHREFMISQANVCVFMYGSGNQDGGMMEEYEIAKRGDNKIIIPLGSTGGTARIISDDIRKNIIRYPYLEKYIEKLEIEKNPQKIARLILKILNEAI